MDYKVELNKEDLNKYLDRLVNKIFAILGIYEDCDEKKTYDDFFIYLDRLCLEIKGCQYSLEIENFLSLYNVLLGISHSEIIEHKKIKSLVFYCISVVKKMKVV